MRAQLFTEPWAAELCRELGASEDYRQAAATWEGALVLEMTADASEGIDTARAVYLDLHRGACRGSRVAVATDLESAAFVLRAEPAQWRRILHGEVEPILAVMTGKLKLVRGQLAKLLPYVKAAKELVRAATRVETDFPPGWGASTAGQPLSGS